MVYCVLLILLLNFFIFNFYYKKSDESLTNISANNTIIEKIKATKFRLKNKEEKLKNATNLFESKSSYLINELIKEVPESILLNELVYHPIEKNIKPNEPIIFKSDVTLISGKTINSKSFTNWIEKINTLKWIKKTTILHFGKNEVNESVFTIQINLNPDEIK